MPLDTTCKYVSYVKAQKVERAPHVFKGQFKKILKNSQRSVLYCPREFVQSLKIKFQ
jgi:hypothetical protein